MLCFDVMQIDVPSFSPKNQASLEKFSENPLIAKRVQLAEDVSVGEPNAVPVLGEVVDEGEHAG